VASLGDKLSLEDTEGNELLYIEQKVFDWVASYEISREGRLLAEVRRNWLSFWKRRFAVTMSGSDDLELIGDFLAFEYVVMRGAKKIATFTKQWLRLSDTYWIRIDDTEPDPVFVLALAVVVEVVTQRRHNY
jgi:uncharacterized protein YxjI